MSGNTEEALEVLREVWSARGQSAEDVEEACGTAKSCKRMTDVGFDTNQALYEWDYARQMLHIRALSEHQLAGDDAVDKLFGPKFLLERPLLEAVRTGNQAVLLIDEIDRADDEFEAFLLEVLSDFQISIPEIGTVKAESAPLVVLTSNRTRELHDALKRRCLYHWIGYPPAEREAEIVLIREPGVSEALARKVVAAVNRLREL